MPKVLISKFLDKLSAQCLKVKEGMIVNLSRKGLRWLC